MFEILYEKRRNTMRTSIGESSEGPRRTDTKRVSTDISSPRMGGPDLTARARMEVDVTHSVEPREPTQENYIRGFCSTLAKCLNCFQENPDVEVNQECGEAHPIEAHPIEAHPIEAHPIEAHPIEAHPIEAHPIEAHPIKTAIRADSETF